MPGRPRVGILPRISALVVVGVTAWAAGSSSLVLHRAVQRSIRRATSSGTRRAASVSSTIVPEGGVALEVAEAPSDTSGANSSSAIVAKGSKAKSAGKRRRTGADRLGLSRPSGKSGNYTKGQKLQGTVTKILRSGIFVDVGANRDGWVHISKVWHGPVERADDVVAVGQELALWVWKPNETRLELSCRPPVDVSGFVGVPEHQWLSGTITAIDWSGFYIVMQPPGGGELQPGKIRRREIRPGWVKNPFSEGEVGQDVRVRVLSVNVTAKKLALTMRGVGQ